MTVNEKCKKPIRNRIKNEINWAICFAQSANQIANVAPEVGKVIIKKINIQF